MERSSRLQRIAWIRLPVAAVAIFALVLVGALGGCSSPSSTTKKAPAAQSAAGPHAEAVAPSPGPGEGEPSERAQVDNSFENYIKALKIVRGKTSFILACTSPDILMVVKSEIHDRKITKEMIPSLSSSGCTALPWYYDLYVMRDVKYVGYSGLVDGPEFMQVYFKEHKGSIFTIFSSDVE